jgi:membrane-associated protein
VLGWLDRYRESAYLVLFLGAFLETLIPISLAVYGEFFFLAGALLAGAGVLDIGTVTAVLLAGGVLGDHASYWMGRRFGRELLERFRGWPLLRRCLSEDAWAQGAAFFRHHGAKAVLIGRLSGPLSWVMPALAGTFRLPYASFCVADSLGVIIGIGQFLLLGYLFGSHLDLMLQWLDDYGFEATVLAVFLVVTLLWWRRRRAAAQGSPA